MSGSVNPIQNAIDCFGDAIAFDDGERKIHYRELSSFFTSGATWRGFGCGDHVAWCPANDLSSFMSFWRLQSVRCVACPISSRFPIERRHTMVRQLNASWLEDSKKERDEVDRPVNPPNADEPATIILSSGSTGKPKAIVHSMSAHVASAQGAATNMPLGPGDRWLWGLPLYHVSGLSILVRCAVAGATVVGVTHASDLSPELLCEQRITHLSVVATQLRRLMTSDQFPSSDLKAVLVGGSSVPSTLVAQARSRGVRVHTTYGLTEMASQVTTSMDTCDPATSGRVLPNRELKIDESGEILVRGDTLCLGYYRDGQIVPVVDEEGWFHTRDVGSLDANGRLSVAGRIDNMFISGGENIYPEVIERALLKLANVEQAIVVPKSDTEFGDRPVAFVKGQLGSDWATELRKSLRGLEIPTSVLDWPENAMLGIKPDRKKLWELANS